MLFKHYVIECTTHYHQGAKPDDLVLFLHSSGRSIVESMVILKHVLGIDLRDAKILVASHPIWSEIATAGEELHDLLEDEFD